jgi:hypothetical protein
MSSVMASLTPAVPLPHEPLAGTIESGWDGMGFCTDVAVEELSKVVRLNDKDIREDLSALQKILKYDRLF